MHIVVDYGYRHVQTNYKRHECTYKDILKLIPNFHVILQTLCRDISVDEGYDGSILKRLVGLVSHL